MFVLFPPPDPRFIGVNLIPESDNPEDDKIFLFFKENAMDGEHTGKATIARIGQLCKVTTHTQTKILTTETHIHFSYISALGLQPKLTFIIHKSDDYFQD